MDNLNIFPIELKEAWELYNKVRVAGNKKAANQLLVQFIGLLKKQDKNHIETFVNTLCSALMDADAHIIDTNGTEVSGNLLRIQHPLFKEIILPVLIDKYKENSAKHIKWIGQLEQFFYTDLPATNAFLAAIGMGDFFSTRVFFEKSYRLDPQQSTVTLFLNRVAADIDYYTHELPHGLLVEPAFLVEELNLFRKYYGLSDNQYLWKATLEEWESIEKHCCN